MITALCVVALSRAAHAQEPTGSITGTVFDAAGAGVPGAVVTITNSARSSSTHVVTSASGSFTVRGLEPGRYEVRIQAASFKEKTTSTLVEIGRVASVRVQLGVEVNERVRVESNTGINRVQPAVDGIVTQTLFTRLPLNARKMFELAQLEPGVQTVRDDIVNRGGFARAAVNGQTGLSTRVAVDGLDIGHELSGSVVMNLSTDGIREFQVNRALFDVSTGLSGIGSVNIATKSGGNDWTGGAFMLYRGNEVPVAGGQATQFIRRQMGASAGGRLVRNRLFLFTSYENNNQEAGVTTTISPFPQYSRVWASPFDEGMATMRLDWNIGPAVQAFARATGDWHEGISSQTFGATKLAPMLSSNRAWQGAAGLNVIAGRLVHQLRVGYTTVSQNSTLGLDQIPGMPPTVDPGGRLLTLNAVGGATGFLIGAHFNAPAEMAQSTLEFRYDGGVSRGAHELRWGADLNFIRVLWYEAIWGSAPQFNLTYTTTSTAACGSDVLCYPVKTVQMSNGLGYFTEPPSHGYPHGGASNDRVHLYAGDTWRINSRLTATLGLRWVYEPGATNPGLVRPAILDTFQAGLASAERSDPNNFAPQVGLVWSPSSSGRWVVRGGIGVFFDTNRLQNVMFTERANLLPAGITAQYTNTIFRSPADSSVVIFDFTGRSPNALITPGVNWQDRPLGSAGLINAVFDAQTAYRAAARQVAADFPSLPSPCEQTRTCMVLSSNYQTPNTRHYTAGFQNELRRGLVLSVDYVHTESAHYLIRHNLNRVGAADTLNRQRAVDAMNAVQLPLSCPAGAAGVDCAIQKLGASPATLAKYVNAGLGSSTAAASASGPSTMAFPGFNPEFNAVTLLDTIGTSTYRGLQINLRGSLPDLGPVVKRPFVVVSYALGRLEGNSEDQFVLNASEAVDNNDPTGFRGPNGMDRTHMLSLGALVTVPGRIQVNVLSKAFSALPQTLYVQGASSTAGAEIFMTDFNGDGKTGDLLPGTNRGSYGRSIGCGAAAINRVIDAYNASQAGQLTPAGRALVSAALFSEGQLKAIGAVSPPVARAPDGQVCLDALYTTDVRFARAFTWRGGRITIEPALEVFNLFNVANHDLPDNKLGGLLTGLPGSLNGTTPVNRSNRADATGSFAVGAPRSWQLVLRVSF